MKRALSALLVLAVLLSGCATQQQEPSEPTESTAQQTETTAPTVPQEDTEQAEDALQTYSLEGTGYYALAVMGDGILLFSGEEETTLTYIKGNEEPITASLPEIFLFPSAAYCNVSEQGVGYYDSAANELVFLDTSLTQTRRVAMPQDMACKPVLSEDWKYAYYFDQAYLRCMELDTGICRLLSDTWGGVPQVIGTHFGGTVIQCCVFQDGSTQEMLIDTQTGQPLYQDEEMWILNTAENWYFSEVHQSWGTEYVFGEKDGQQRSLIPADAPAFLQVLPEERAVALCEYSETGFRVELYDLETGMRNSSLTMEGLFYSGMAADMLNERIWILAEDIQTGAQALYSWDPAQDPTEDTADYTDVYHTAEVPDTEGLTRVAAEAQKLGDKYSVKVLVYQQAAERIPANYILEAEHAVAAYDYYLTALDQVLSVYPENFLKKLGKSSGNSRLTVCLVKAAWYNGNMGEQAQTDGVQFWDDGNAYLTLVMNDSLQATVYRELYYAIDTYILTQTQAFDFWDQLNPEGFQYANGDQQGEFAEDHPYFQEETRAFIDENAMRYAKEDRAIIMEYAMQPGNEEFFTSDIMQEKLRAVCAGIRETFGLTREPTVFLWEQYLNTPMI